MRLEIAESSFQMNLIRLQLLIVSSVSELIVRNGLVSLRHGENIQQSKCNVDYCAKFSADALVNGPLVA